MLFDVASLKKRLAAALASPSSAWRADALSGKSVTAETLTPPFASSGLGVMSGPSSGSLGVMSGPSSGSLGVMSGPSSGSLGKTSGPSSGVFGVISGLSGGVLMVGLMLS